jgi:hypothetical protein
VSFVSLIATGAAVVAAWYAYRAARETHALRREERLARVPEIVAELGQTTIGLTQGQVHQVYWLPIHRARLEAAVVASGEALPACEALARADFNSQSSAEAVTAAVNVALAELAERLRPAPPPGTTEATGWSEPPPDEA